MNIAKMAIKLSADSTGFAREMAKASATVQRFATASGSAMGGLAKTLGVGGLLSGLAGGGVFLLFRNGLNDLEKFDRQARRLGMTVTDLRAAMHWGGGADSMGGIVGSVQGQLADARMGGVGAMGNLLDLRRASGASANAGSFGDVVEQLSKIENPATRAAHAFRLMGEGASDVLHALNGPGGLADARGVVERMGMGASGGDMNAVRQAAQAMRELDMLGKGFMQQVILGLAPLFASIGEELRKWGPDMRRIKDLAFDAGVAVGWIAVLLTEGTKNSQLFWDAFNVGLKLAEAGLMSLSAKMAKLLQQAVGGDAKYVGLDDILLGTWGGGKLGGDTDAMDKAAAKAMAEARKQFDALKGKLGGTDTGKAWQDIVDRANKMRNATGGVTEELTKQLPLLNKMAQQFGQMAGSVAGPGDAFRQQMAQIQQAGALGFGGGGVLSMLFARAGADLVSGTGVGQYRAAGAALGNTREAYSAIAQAQQTQRRDPIELIKAALDADARRQDLQIQQGQAIEAAIKANRLDLKKKEL